MRAIILALAASTLALGGLRDNCRSGLCIPPAKPAVTVTVPVTAVVAAVGTPAPTAPPKPFPGPSTTPPRVLWVWDNGVVFDSSAGVWRWQNDDGTWNQK